MDSTPPRDVTRLRELIAAGDFDALDAELGEMHPADLADALARLDTPEQIVVLRRLDTERAAEVLTELDRNSGQALLLLLSDRDVVDLLSEMPSDDAVDILSTLPAERTERVDRMLPEEDRAAIRELMEFDEESAGGIMEVERVAVPVDATIGDAVAIVRRNAEDVENLQKIFVVDGDGVLQGQLNVLDLIMHEPDTPVADVMERQLITVPVGMDQEEVAALFGKYDAFTLPVVDERGRLVGRITVDDIIDVIEEEASEDIAHIAGTTEEEIGETSVTRVSRTRLPWLVVALLGEAVNAVVMSIHQATLQTFVVLAFFIPLIIATAGNTGSQAAVVVVREIALGQVDIRRIGSRVMREVAVALLNGLVLGVLLFLIAFAWQRDAGLGVLLFASLVMVMLTAAFMGVSVPLLLNRWGVDPAIATGPFVSLSNDVVGLAIYLGMAGVYLSHHAGG